VQILIDWEDPISRTHVLALTDWPRRHMVRCEAGEPVKTIFEALEEWAEDETRKQTRTRPNDEAGAGRAAGSKHNHEDGAGD
jgi:hypothetical protein